MKPYIVYAALALAILFLGGAEVESQIRDVMNQPKDVIERVMKLSQ